MTLYKIADWQKHFETHDTRKLASLRWVPLPNKHDGLTFRHLGASKNAAELYAAWVLIVQVASKSDREHRGELVRNGRPMTAADLSIVTGFPAGVFERAFAYFTQNSVGWMVAEDYQTDLPLLAAEAGNETGEAGFAPANLPLNGRKEGKKERSRTASPTQLPFSSEAFGKAWATFEQHRREIRKPITATAGAMALNQLAAMGEARAIRAIEHTIAKGWQGIREPDGTDAARHAQSSTRRPDLPEPDGWRAWVNDHSPDAVYARGNEDEGKQWGELERVVQDYITKQLSKGR